MLDLFETLVNWYMVMSEKPLFMLAQGLVLGLVIAGAVWMLCRAFKEEAEDGD